MGQSQEIVSYISQHGASRTYLFRNGVTPERFQNIPNKKGRMVILLLYMPDFWGLLKAS